jgi:hypothetical protein
VAKQLANSIISEYLYPKSLFNADDTYRTIPEASRRHVRVVVAEEGEGDATVGEGFR